MNELTNHTGTRPCIVSGSNDGAIDQMSTQLACHDASSSTQVVKTAKLLSISNCFSKQRAKCKVQSAKDSKDDRLNS